MKNNKSYVAMAVLLIASIVIISGLLWDYSISSIMIAMHRPDTFKLWMGYVLAFIPGMGQLCFPVAAIVWVVMMFV